MSVMHTACVYAEATVVVTAAKPKGEGVNPKHPQPPNTPRVAKIVTCYETGRGSIPGTHNPATTNFISLQNENK